jgi:hypothetical protein
MKGSWDQRRLCQLLVALQCLSTGARVLLNLSGKGNKRNNPPATARMLAFDICPPARPQTSPDAMALYTDAVSYSYFYNQPWLSSGAFSRYDGQCIPCCKPFSPLYIDSENKQIPQQHRPARTGAAIR